MSGALLLDERMVSAQPSLVREFGLTNAVVLQQIHWHFAYTDSDVMSLDGHDWYPITQTALAVEIGVSREVVRRAVDALEQRGVLVSCQPEGHRSRRKWYRIDRTHEVFVQLVDSPIRKGSSAQLPVGDTPTSSTSQPLQQEPPTENPSETSAKKPRARFAEYDALMEVFGSDDMTRQEQAFFAKVARELRDQGKSPSEIIDRGNRARQRYKTCTVNILLKQWSSLAPPEGRRAGSTFEDVAARDRMERTRV